MPRLNYHVDVHYVMPRDLYGDPTIAQALKLTGIEMESPGNTKLLFRDPATIEALRAGPDWLVETLQEAGFGLAASGRSSPIHAFDAAEDRHRMEKCSRLMTLLSERDGGLGRFEGGFDTRLLFAHECRMQALAAQMQSGDGEAEVAKMNIQLAQKFEAAAEAGSNIAAMSAPERREPAMSDASGFARMRMDSHGAGQPAAAAPAQPWYARWRKVH